MYLNLGWGEQKTRFGQCWTLTWDVFKYVGWHTGVDFAPVEL